MVSLARRHPGGLLAGAFAALIALEVLFVANTLGLLPFAPYAFGLAVVDALPGWVSSAVIDALQFWAKTLLEIGVVALVLLTGAYGGALLADGATRGQALLVAAIPWALSVLGAALSSSRQFDPLGTTLAGAVALAAYSAGLSWSTPRLDAARGMSRRRVLVGMGAIVVALGAGGMFLSSLGRRSAQVAQRLVLPKPAAVTVAPFAPEDPAFDATPGLSPQLTANADFYIVDTALFKPRVDVATWRLAIDGHVDRPYELTYNDLLAMDAVEQVQTLECISNPVGGELISTATWVGARMPDLLSRAGVRAEAYDLVMTSVDGYTDSIPIQKALEPTTLVAYAMNGDVLPVDHGYPARVLVPDIYGMKNVKWLARLTVENYDYKGYWQERGWADPAVIVTNSRIDVPQPTVAWSGGAVRIAGIAHAGSRGISRVEVSTDQGRSWNDAKLGRLINGFTWRRWYFDWTPAAAGDARLMVRATDGLGVPQVSAPRDPFPAGATGYHLVTVHVTKAG
jgi:DMSO/TMAO reductase YedYZ molybdopterin-dependent catalytic subunit